MSKDSTTGDAKDTTPTVRVPGNEPPDSPLQLPATVIETDHAAPIPVTRLLAPGTVILGLRLIEPLAVSSGEADLWLVEPGPGAARQVFKLYRDGVRPKLEILKRLQEFKREHVVQLFSYGEIEGRYYEIQEYVAEGNLAEWIHGRAFDSPQVCQVLEELTMALEHLQEFKVLHRDIKPANILVRSRQPLDLVLTDFGISSVSDISLHLTSVNRTPAYCAPETLTGVVSRSSDWWSLGVILLEMLTGKHPLSGQTEQAINFQLVGRGIPVPAVLPAEWQLLLRGLLTRDYKHRWRAAEVRRWLSGARDIPVHEDAGEAPAQVRRPYKFDTKDYFETGPLAEAMAQNWDEAAKHWGMGYVLKWVEQELGDADLALRLREMQRDALLRPEFKLSVALLALHPDLPLVVQGNVIDQAACEGNPDLAAAIAQNSIGTWLKKFRDEDWLETWTLGYRETQADARRCPFKLDAARLPVLLCSPPARLESAVADVRRDAAGARDPVLARLFQKETLSRAEAVRLAAADPALFFSREEKELEERMAAIKARGWNVDERLARTLLAANQWSVLRPAWEKLRNHWQKRKRSAIKLAHPGIQAVLEHYSPDLVDAVAVAANHLEFINFLGMRFVPLGEGTVFMSVWHTRLQDFDAFLKSRGGTRKSPVFAQDASHPVVNVSWDDAMAFCEWITGTDRKAGRIGVRDLYRLPTDLEWSASVGLVQEHGGSPRERNGKIPGIFPWGTEWPPPAGAGNLGGDSSGDKFAQTAPVGTSTPNKLGLQDMGTNVMEWCMDWYDEDINLKVVRGGSWFHSTPDNLWSSNRRRFTNTHACDSLGFRVVLQAVAPPPPPTAGLTVAGLGNISKIASKPAPATPPPPPPTPTPPAAPEPKSSFWKFLE